MYKLFIFVFIGWNIYKFNFMTIPMVHHGFAHHDHTYGPPWMTMDDYDYHYHYNNQKLCDKPHSSAVHKSVLRNTLA